MKNPLLLLSGIVASLLAFTVTAHAANAIDPTDGSLDLAKAVYDAFRGGHYAFAAATMLVVVVALVRKYLGGRIPALHTDAGAACLVLAGSFGTALSASLAGGGPMTWGLAEASFGVAFAAAGGYAAVKKLVIEPLAPKLPAWIAGPLSWLFAHASDPGNTAAAQDVHTP